MKLTGNSSKDSKYLKRIKDAIEHDKSHPRNNGVKMQAHHVISAEGMKRSELGKKIESFGYDINLLDNLVFIPCTLQGACHLSVQLHRGNHTANQDDYDDDSEPGSYHEMVRKKIKGLRLPISKECLGNSALNSKEVIDKINDLSKIILKLIQKRPDIAPLTSIAKNFLMMSLHGCGGVDSVTRYSIKKICSVGRDHLNRQAQGQAEEKITYIKNGEYIFKIGR